MHACGSCCNEGVFRVEKRSAAAEAESQRMTQAVEEASTAAAEASNAAMSAQTALTNAESSAVAAESKMKETVG